MKYGFRRTETGSTNGRDRLAVLKQAARRADWKTDAMRRQSPKLWMASALQRLARSERGFTVPMTLIVMVVGLGLGSAAVIASINAQRGTTRDQRTKSALAVADSGIQVALYRQNKVLTTEALPCVVRSNVGAATELVKGLPESDGWCQAQTGSGWTYRVKPWTLVGSVESGFRQELQIVSVGTASGIQRRIALTASARSGAGVFGGKGAIGVDHVQIEGSSKVGTTQTNTHVATNGTVTVAGSATLCGNAYEGVNQPPVDPSYQCPGFGTFENQLSVPPIDPITAATVRATNSDARICFQDFATPSSQCSPIGGNKNVSWNPATRTLNMQGNTTLTLGATDPPYSFCKLVMGGSSKIIVAQGASVTIYFDDPEHCPGLTGDQISMSGNPRLTTTSQNPGDLKIFMVGSATTPTSAYFTGNPATDSTDYDTFTLYAPLTNVTLYGNPTYVGAVAAKNLTVSGSAFLLQDARATAVTVPIVTTYQRDRYVECTGGAMPTSPSPPNGSC